MKSNRKHMNILPFPNYNKRPQSTKKFSMPHQFANKVVPFDSRNMLYQNINQKQNYISDYLHPRITNTDSLDYLNPNFKMTPTTDKYSRTVIKSPSKIEERSNLYVEAEPVFKTPNADNVRVGTGVSNDGSNYNPMPRFDYSRSFINNNDKEARIK